MRVYVAASYSLREEMVAVHEQLRLCGHEPVSRWVEGAEEQAGMTQAQKAVLDLTDVARADAILFFCNRSEGARGGGRWFEFGAAYAMGNTCVQVQREGTDLESIFNHAPGVHTVRSVKEACDLLAALEREAEDRPTELDDLQLATAASGE